ncbi:hypothetical protein COJ85_05060 [Bacillus sp. AFS076308]|uniref:hypothetical protein n=1 Tax=Bacillus sp. AFS076308 TaxID=2033512 RepID=UPI000BF4AAF0|nr:hypothetical protein [Bacillus sp. AFS076308]PFO08040.1 hypothetical protein COJ85_05060 [Bacillus sp. AFS076308]
MNSTLIDFHKKRFEWAFMAKEEFLNHFDPYKNEGLSDSLEDLLHILQTDLENPNEPSFDRLNKFFQEADEEMKMKLKNYEKQIEPYELLITKQSSIIDHKKEEARIQEDGFAIEIDDYDRFLKQIELKNTESDHIWVLVDDTIEYTPQDRKASIINEDVSRLQIAVERDLGTSILILKQEAHFFKIELATPLELPFVPPIPAIEQKIDAFWFKNTYEKALFKMRSQAHDWVTEMYQNYNRLLTSILYEITTQREQAVKEAEASKLEYRQKINTLENQLVTYQKEEAQLKARYQKACQVWNQFQKHASQLQGYLIKHWLEYKEELQQDFLYGNAEGRFLAAQYLQLLRKDGQKIIESVNRGGDV